MASFVLLSALAIPVITSSRTRLLEIDDNKSKTHKLAALLGMSRSPTRSGLLKEALNKNILRRVRPELKDLYNILEVQFHPLSICKKIEPIMTHLAQDVEMAKYVKPLHQVILTRLFQQLSQVYDTVKLEFVINLASFAPPYNYDAATIEKFIMNGCKKGELSIRIDHSTRSLTFETDLFAASKNADADGAKLQASPADRMRDQLSKLAKCFYTTVHMIDPTIIQNKKEARAQAISRALIGMEEEHINTLARKAIIERRRELVETLLVRKEKEEQRERAIRKKQKDEELKQRQLEESKRREIERKKREIEAIQKEEARKLAESLKAKNFKLVLLEDLENMDTDSLVQLQVAQLEKEKRELNERLRATAKRMDHLERAYRKEEIPLLEKDYERQMKADKAYHEAARKLQLEISATKHTEDLKVKERLMRILPDYKKYREEIESKRSEEFEQRRRAAQDKIAEEKEKRRQLYRIKKEEERKRKEAEEEARRKAEEEELRRKEAEERAEQERIAKAEADKLEYEARMRKLDEQAAKQREAERLAEEKQLQREREKEQRRNEEKEEKERESENARRRHQAVEKPSGGGYVPPNKRTTEPTWRRESQTTTSSHEESGAWTAPWRRTGSGRATVPEDGSRRREPTRQEEPEWRRSDSGRGSTIEEKNWRSGGGTSTEETQRRRTSFREESSTKQEGSWRRSGLPSDRGDRSDSKRTKNREDPWRKDTEDSDPTSPSSSRGSTHILNSESTWRTRSKQSESSVMERSSSEREIWTATLKEQNLDKQDDRFHDEPEEDSELLVRSEDNLKTQASVSSSRQNIPVEPDDDGFIPVTKGKRRW